MDAILELGLGLILALVAVAPAALAAARRPLLRRAAFRSARGHLRQGVAVALTAAIATSVVAGALVVGDSMSALVDQTATDALPGIDAVIRSPRPFSESVYEGLEASSEWSPHVRHGAPILTVPAATTCGRTGLRDGQVVLYGFDTSLYELAAFREGGRPATVQLGAGEAAINRHLADQTGARVGDTVTVVVPNPGAWGDFLFLFGEDSSLERTFTVRSIVDDADLGRLDLEAKRTPQSGVFVSLEGLQEMLGVEGQVNTVLLQWRDGSIVGTDKEDEAVADLESRLDALVGARDMGLSYQASPQGWQVVVSDRVFLPGDLEPRLGTAGPRWSPTLTYFVDSLVGAGRLAYSTVSGIDFARDLSAFGDWDWNATSPQEVPGPGTREALVNNWTAEALGIGTGGKLKVDYTVVDDRQRLRQRSVELTVVGVVDLEGKAADPAMLPPIPGVNDAVSCLDWDPPFPINLSTIGPRDVAYWDQYKGTPKVWIDLGTARELWSNPDGNWTGARFRPEGDLNDSTAAFDEAIVASDVGLVVVPARADALATGGALAIFEQMFVAFGAVLVLAGCLLEATAFGNLARARTREHATLRALGLDRGGLVRLLLLEGTLWGLVAAIVGAVAGAALGGGLVWGLNTAWADAVEGTRIPFALSAGSLAIAVGAGLVVTVITLAFAARAAARRELATTLADRQGGSAERRMPGHPLLWVVLGLVLVLAPVTALPSVDAGNGLAGTSLFFALGMLATLGILAVLVGLLKARATTASRISAGRTTRAWMMGLRALGRRPRRALVLVATFAIVSFSVVGISWAGAMELERAGGTGDSRTGGYDLVAETWVSMPEGPTVSVPLDDWDYFPVKVVGTQGGTCSNLNARFPPRAMGMSEDVLRDITVGFRSSSVGDARETWMSLLEPTDSGRTPIVVDSNTLIWIYGGSLGEVYEVTGDTGQVYELEVVGVMEGSIFAGSFVMGLPSIERIYPDSAVYTYFLFETGSTPPDVFAATLERDNAAFGLDARTTEQMVKDSLGYELAFLRLFQAYLALGLVVGAVGLGALASREVSVRRREIGTMRALGWTRGGVGRAFLAEQLWIAFGGLAAGLYGAFMVTLGGVYASMYNELGLGGESPLLWLGSSGGGHFPVMDVGLVAVAVMAAAAAGAAASAWAAARMEVVEALRAVE